MRYLLKRKSKARNYRLLQLITGVHRIHHIKWSYGWKLPLLPIAYFDDKFEHIGGKSYGLKIITDGNYHNCSKTGAY